MKTSRNLEWRHKPKETVGDGVNLRVVWTLREPVLLKKGLHLHQRRDGVLPVIDAELAIAHRQCLLLLAQSMDFLVWFAPPITLH